ncbi:hypothetical protein LTR17_026855 [Elasticomyces elasticus]|nr:hypothetical protein LTR17_026855 [Elasticomyces elasticus]
MPLAGPRAVETVLIFHGGQKTFSAGTVGDKRRAHVPIPTTILDIRGHESDFSLDKQGFQFVNHGTEVKGEQFEDEEIVKGISYQECEKLVMEKTGASRVVPISYIVRRQNWDAVEKMEKGMCDLERTVAPVNARYVHVDQSPAGARNRMIDRNIGHIEVASCAKLVYSTRRIFWYAKDIYLTHSLAQDCKAKKITSYIALHCWPLDG